MAKYEARKAVKHKGQTIYEWEQHLDEVDVFINPPPGVGAKQLEISIATQHLKVGIKGNPPYINFDLAGQVNAEDSLWMIEDGELHINLAKQSAGQTWPSLFVGIGELDEAEQEAVQKDLMLQRFQAENPGFDFSQATFNGAAPDATTFMGGVDHNKIQENRG